MESEKDEPMEGKKRMAIARDQVVGKLRQGWSNGTHFQLREEQVLGSDGWHCDYNGTVLHSGKQLK